MLNVALMLVCFASALLILPLTSSRNETPACVVAMILFIVASILAFVDLAI